MNDLKILFEDKHITVCVKPPELLSQQDTKGSPDMLSVLEEKIGIPHKPVHRLDRGVGGVMVYAKNEIAAAKLSQDIQNGNFKKEYLAVICGKPIEDKGVYKDLLFKDSAKNKSYVVDRKRKGVKEASLEYTLVGSKKSEEGTLSCVRILLHTGRTHQIRVQFASRKTAVYGDGKYGSKNAEKTIALWSHTLSFPHPKTKEPLHFVSYPENVFPWEFFNENLFSK